MRVYLRKAIALLLSVLLLVSSGCALREREEGEDFSIVASFYPMYIMLLNITDGIDNVHVHVMAQQHTGCLHDYQLQSSDMQELTKADVFVVNGAGMENFLSRVTEQLPDLRWSRLPKAWNCCTRMERPTIMTRTKTTRKKT
ncbi:MAG: metal ABC transporter solute-binding protein, Zn/Mn family [Acutalibacteraceae bacterium]